MRIYIYVLSHGKRFIIFLLFSRARMRVRVADRQPVAPQHRKPDPPKNYIPTSYHTQCYVIRNTQSKTVHTYNIIAFLF